MVKDALVSGVRTRIASRSGVAGSSETRHGQQQAKPRKILGPWSLVTLQDSYCSSDGFHGQNYLWNYTHEI